MNNDNYGIRHNFVAWRKIKGCFIVNEVFLRRRPAAFSQKKKLNSTNAYKKGFLRTYSSPRNV